MEDGSNPFGERGSPPESAQPPCGETAPALRVPPQSHRRPSRLTVLVSIAVALAIPAVLLNVASGSGSTAPPRITSFSPLPAPPLGGAARYFTTAGPPSWALTMSFPDQDVTDYVYTSTTSFRPPGTALPPPGTIEIQIEDIGPAAVPTVLGKRAATQTPLELLKGAYAPRGSEHVVRSPGRSLLLAGRPAAEQSYRYRYQGQRNIQTELVTRRGGEIVSIEMDNDPSMQVPATAALRAIARHWKWLTRATAIRPPTLPAPRQFVPPPGILPSGQWIASGFIDGDTGGVADAKIDQPEVRAWDFTRDCVTGPRCRVELTRELLDGGTSTGPIMQEAGSAGWFQVTFPVVHTLCARRPTGPPLRETIRTTLGFGWVSAAHRALVADDRETILGCGSPVPSVLGDHWTARRVPLPSSIPTLSIDPRHASSAAAFREAAGRVCSASTGRAARIARATATALRLFDTSKSPETRATAEAAIASQITSILALSAARYSQTPQPPPGGLDASWTRDVDAIREQITPGAAASSALRSGAIALRGFLESGRQLQLETALSEATFASEDLGELAGPALGSTLLEQSLDLPATCTAAPSVYSVLSPPQAR